jgi:hypothetical protein
MINDMSEEWSWGCRGSMGVTGVKGTTKRGIDEVDASLG